MKKEEIAQLVSDLIDRLFVCPLCRTRVPIQEWGSQSIGSPGAIIMRCRSCDAETQYYVDEEKTEKAIRDRVLSRCKKKTTDAQRRNIVRQVDEALRTLHDEEEA
jgi:hypothetical protein